MSCATCSEREAVQQWCGCRIICEQCMRNTVLETGSIRCIHCRKTKPPSSRMMYMFLKDVFARKKKYAFARQTLQDLDFARKLYDFLVEHNMDTRLLVELLPRATPELALHIIANDPKRFCVFRHDVRNTPEVALKAVELYNQNIEYVDQPTPLPVLELLSSMSGLVHVPDEERPLLEHKYDAILARPGNVDIFRLPEPTRRQWLIAAKATPILASRVPGANLETADGVLEMADACRSVGFYRYLDERLRADRFLAYELLQRQLSDYGTDFCFLEHVLFKPSKIFTEGCLRSCPRSIQFAADYDESAATDCVRTDGLLLRHSLITTLGVCRAAVTQNGLALEHCPPHLARRLQVLAVASDRTAVRFAPDKHTYPMMEISMPDYLVIYGAEKIPAVLLNDFIKLDPALLRHVAYEYQTEETVRIGDKRYANPALLASVEQKQRGSKMDLFIKKHGVDVLAFTAPP